MTNSSFSILTHGTVLCVLCGIKCAMGTSARYVLPGAPSPFGESTANAFARTIAKASSNALREKKSRLEKIVGNCLNVFFALAHPRLTSASASWIVSPAEYASNASRAPADTTTALAGVCAYNECTNGANFDAFPFARSRINITANAHSSFTSANARCGPFSSQSPRVAVIPPLTRTVANTPLSPDIVLNNPRCRPRRFTSPS
mmetsp:Transcript_5139/g.17018  ORF Transcript_5139/g.17018 Transcript_5139/m.17018 type:complete len:203 (+) Transcript_5139:2419-3027(+)